MKKEKSFVKAGAILVVSGFGVKVLSAVYRIPLTRMMGPGAMGRYSIVFSLFMPFFSIATGGIATSISHFTAREIRRGNGKIGSGLGRKSIKLYLILSVLPVAAFLVFSGLYSVNQDDRLIFYGALLLAPSIFFAVCENVIKGRTQGRMDMLPTAKANLLESVCKTGLGLTAVYCIKEVMHSTNADLSVIASLAAVSFSGLICCLYLLLISGKANVFLKEKTQKNNGCKNISCKDLLKMSLPIAVSALVVSLVNFFETTFCLPRIDKIPYQSIVQSFQGASFKNAGDITVYLFGVYQGMVMTIFNLLPAVTASVATASLPVMSGSAGVKEMSRQVAKLFTTTGIAAAPAIVYLFCFRSDIVTLLFGTNPAQTVVASDLLRIILPAGFFCAFVPCVNSVLYAMGKSAAVFRILLSASVIKCSVNYLLCPLPYINIKSFAVSACVFYAIIFVMSMATAVRNGISLPLISAFVLPVTSAAGALIFTRIVTDTALCYLPLLFKVGFSGVIYCLIYILFVLTAGFFIDISL